MEVSAEVLKELSVLMFSVGLSFVPEVTVSDTSVPLPPQAALSMRADKMEAAWRLCMIITRGGVGFSDLFNGLAKSRFVFNFL